MQVAKVRLSERIDMKTNMLSGWRWVFAVTSTTALLGCLDRPGESNAQSANTVITSNNIVAEPSPAADEAPPLKAIIPPADLSPGLQEVIKLAQSAVGDEVLLAYIDKSGTSFNPTVDEIVYLKDLGLSEEVIASLVRTREGTAPAPQASPAPPENANVVQAPAATENRPSLTEPPAPSYSVAAEPAYTEAAAAPNQQVNISYFESTLSPYGSWVDVPDYGRCWQPTVVVVNRNWRPYSDRGRWIYTSAGWYWQSDYSWGWAPFHYGRWHQDHRIGWVWAPGSTWGPAWVSWRYTDSYCGWAPLPPLAHYDSFGFSYYSSRVGISFDFGLRDHHYTFIPTSRFCDRTPHRYYVSGSHSTTIYQNSVVINNYVRGNNNTIINEGIGRDRISRATRTPIRTVALRDLPTTATPVGRAERLEGNSLAVFRPNVAAQTSLARSRTGTVRTVPATTANRNSPSAGSTGVPERSVATSSRIETGRSIQRETATPTPVVRSTEQSQATFPRTWSQPSGATRNSGAQPAQRQLSTGRTDTSGTPASSGDNQSTRGASGLRQSPAAQYSAPAQRQIPSSIAEHTRAREATVPQQQITRSQPSAISVPQAQPAQRVYNQQPVQNNGATPNVSRSQPSVRQPSYSVPNSGNGGSRYERSVPQAIQSFPRPSAPTVSAPREQPQQRMQSQPQRSAPAPRQQVDRSERGNRDRNRN